MMINIPVVTVDEKDLIKDLIVNLILERKQAKIKFDYIDNDKIIPVYLAIISISDISFDLSTKPSASVQVSGINMNNNKMFNIKIKGYMNKSVIMSGSVGDSPVSIRLSDNNLIVLEKFIKLFI